MTATQTTSSGFVYVSPVRERVCRALVHGTLGLYRLLCMRALRVQREAPTPAGPKLIALNHANASDALALPFIFPDPLVGLAQADLFHMPVLGRWIDGAGWVCVAPGQVRAVLAAARCQLERGRSLVVCPEGRLNHGGPLQRAHTGVVRLALDSGLPIIPVGCYVPPRFLRRLRSQKGGGQTMGRWQTGGPLYVEIGAALWPQPAAGGRRSYQVLRELTDDLMARIAALVAQAEARAAQ
jgi:1-acyl-sn-glycerol-3-phosphate acyltransferase